MIRVPGKFIYLCTPHTGSRSTAEALIKQCGGENLLPQLDDEPNKRPRLLHHAHKQHFDRLDRKRYPEPFYAVIRNPYEFITRCYWYRNRGNQPSMSLDRYIEELRKDVKADFMGPIIASYMDYVDKYFLFERGLEDFFFQVGFPYVEVPRTGYIGSSAWAPRLKEEDLTPEQKRSIEKKWPRDVELYQRVKEEWNARSCNVVG